MIEAGHLFDHPPKRAWTTRFLESDGHHLVLAYVGDDPAGFVSGIEVHHPDKETEMLLYELGVEEGFRQRGVGTELAVALRQIAEERGCFAMWVPIDIDNEAAIATYRAAGAGRPEPAAIQSWRFSTE